MPNTDLGIVINDHHHQISKVS